jgi:hypothetical protein
MFFHLISSAIFAPLPEGETCPRMDTPAGSGKIALELIKGGRYNEMVYK